MNIYSKLLLGAAALSMAACSSDEPEAPAAGNGSVEEGTTLYLSVNITNANDARSRANATGEEGDLVFGSLKEHTINRADFLFYDAEGNFASRANVWSSSDDTEAPNIEYMGQHTLTLRNLTKDQLPAYVITVLNAPAEFSEKVQNEELNMEQTRMEQFNITNGQTFVMSTTSFLDGDANRYDNAHYYATKLQPSDFLTEVPTAAQALSKRVDIYVERLAAKFTLGELNTNNTFPVELTIAGLENSENGSAGETVSASTTVYVKIEGFGLSGQEATSYLSKNIDGFTATGLWNNWNDADRFRSYWGKSVNYDNAEGLTYATFAQCNNDPSEPIYGFETTKSLGNIRTANNSLIGSKVTNILITAKVCEDIEGTKPLELVQYAGVYFTYPQFKKYVLSKLQTAGQLQYWTNETSETTEVEVPVEGSTNKVTTTTYSYEPLDEKDFEWADGGNAGVTGDIILVYKGEGTLYKKGENYKEGDRLVEATDGVEKINAELANFDPQSPAIAFNGGAMFYSVPVEHLLGRNQQKDYKVEAEGEYGIVRNHWYNLTVSKVMSLGHGVFNPNGMEGQETGEELIPDEEKTDRYALSTRINVLSWKIVKQDVTL